MHSEPSHADTGRLLTKKKPHLDSRDKLAPCLLIANERKSAKTKVLFNELSIEKRKQENGHFCNF